MIVLECGTSFCILLINVYFVTDTGYGSIIPDAKDAESHPLTKALGEKVGNYVEQYIEAMEKVCDTYCRICDAFFIKDCLLF